MTSSRLATAVALECVAPRLAVILALEILAPRRAVTTRKRTQTEETDNN